MLNSFLQVVFASVLASFSSPQDQAAPATMPLEETAGWAVQSGGRAKPLETHAREQILAITGKKSIDGLDALQFFWGYHFDAVNYRARPYIRVNSKDLREQAGLNVEELRFSLDDLMGNEGFQLVVIDAIERERADQELNALQTDALRVYDKVQRVTMMMEGESLRVIAAMTPDGPWSSLNSAAKSSDPHKQAVYENYSKLSAAYQSGDAAAFAAAAREIGSGLRAMGGEFYPTEEILNTELRYNSLNTFGKAWVLYLVAFLLFTFLGRGTRRAGFWLAFAALVGGFLLHTYGIALRWQIAGRAPVSDMYESLVFMGWGILGIGIALEAFHRKGYFGMATALMGFLALAFAENLPLDSSISPLVPVLANTSWLSIHVMTIMLAYSAFALALGIGHIVLILQLFKPGRTERLRSLSALLYKTLQVGVLFLAAGIAFGAIWANESWGRYWGWDPKETWSLITFFVYMALIHARFAGWLNHFGLAICSIVGFQAVLMTYYGVNFILGAGLHSYGFSSGGLIFLLGYVGIETAILVGAFFRYRRAIAPMVAADPLPA